MLIFFLFKETLFLRNNNNWLESDLEKYLQTFTGRFKKRNKKFKKILSENIPAHKDKIFPQEWKALKVTTVMEVFI